MSGGAGDPHVTELLTLYYLDALDRVEGRLVAAHLGDCTDCRGAAEAVIETIAVLALLPEKDREELLDNFGALNRAGPPPARFVEFLAHQPEPEPTPGLRRQRRDRGGPVASRAAKPEVAKPEVARSEALSSDTRAPGAPQPLEPATPPPVTRPLVARPLTTSPPAPARTTSPSPLVPPVASPAARPPSPLPVAPPSGLPSSGPPASAVPSSAPDVAKPVGQQAVTPPPAVPPPAATPAQSSPAPAAAAPAPVPRVVPRPAANVSVVAGPPRRSSEALASEPIVPTDEHPRRTRPANREEPGRRPAGPLRTQGLPVAAVSTAPAVVRNDHRRPGGEAQAERRTVPTRRRRGAMVRAGLMLTTALAVAGLAIGALVQHVDRVAPPLAVTVTAVAADSATGASLSVVATAQGDGVGVKAAVDGLKKGIGYRLMAASSDGRVWRVLSWEADDKTQNVSGHLAVPLDSVASFTVARAGGGAVVTANVPPRE
ncbi:hypothetical protein ACFYL6_20310 [Micromonospora sp. NPDC007208]|uniref:zf-HC2 domain-containing protein n=1 Tax=Micromonospora sp. NPDC007208 TaxID=3364236 RepID=UPI0036AB2256